MPFFSSTKQPKFFELVLLMALIMSLVAAVVGSLSTLILAVLGVAVSRAYDGTIFPLVSGFILLGISCVAVMAVTKFMSVKIAKQCLN